jgi:hypothetical protein
LFFLFFFFFVAVANRPERLKMPAPTIEPMTIAVSEESGSFSELAVAAEGAEAAVAVISLPFTGRRAESRRSFPREVRN